MLPVDEVTYDESKLTAMERIATTSHMMFNTCKIRRHLKLNAVWFVGGLFHYSWAPMLARLIKAPVTCMSVLDPAKLMKEPRNALSAAAVSAAEQVDLNKKWLEDLRKRGDFEKLQMHFDQTCSYLVDLPDAHLDG